MSRFSVAQMHTVFCNSVAKGTSVETQQASWQVLPHHVPRLFPKGKQIAPSLLVCSTQDHCLFILVLVSFPNKIENSLRHKISTIVECDLLLI